MGKLIICIDFDGVIHDYLKGWQDGSIYGNVTPGFFEWAIEARLHFKLVIYSSRSTTDDGIEAMKTWLRKHGDAWQDHGGDEGNAVMDVASWFEFASEKPPAFLTIDDRCIRFEGRWDGIDVDPVTLANYRTWSQK
jgi:hypothetical protein